MKVLALFVSSSSSLLSSSSSSSSSTTTTTTTILCTNDETHSEGAGNGECLSERVGEKRVKYFFFFFFSLLVLGVPSLFTPSLLLIIHL